MNKSPGRARLHVNAADTITKIAISLFKDMGVCKLINDCV